jgi:uncharacterized repeat protein (TIGR02543 family)
MKKALKETILFMLVGAFALFTSCERPVGSPKQATSYTVIFESNDGSAVNRISVEPGKIITRPDDPVKPGYDFAGWFRDNETFESEWNFATDKVTTNLTLYAKWEDSSTKASAWLIFNGPAITDVSSSGLRVSPEGNVATLAPVMVENGGQWALEVKDYNYWFIDKEEIKNAATVTMKITYYDNAAGSFNVQYSNSSGNNPAFREIPVQKSGTGQYVTVSITLENCVFDGSQNQNQDAQFRFTSGAIIKSVSLTAADTQNVTRFTVTFNKNTTDNVANMPLDVTINAGGTVAKPAANPSRVGYTFDNWYTAPNGGSVYDFSTAITDDLMLYAKWEPVSTPTDPVRPPGLADPSAFIDLSGYTGSSALSSHQPPTARPGAFTLTNGITGSGLRISNDGEGGNVSINQYGSGKAAKSSGGFLYFFIDNTTVKAASTVTLEVKYYDDMAGSANIQYCSTTNAFAGGGSILKSGTEQYVTAWITLKDCGFNSRTMNQSAHFRIGNSAIVQSIHIILGGLPDPTDTPPPAFAPESNLNNIIGKGVAGYQAWFNTGSGHHWARNGVRPGPNNVNVEMWPITEDYAANNATLYPTNFANLGSGSPSVIFNSRDREVIFTHFQWMQKYGIDCAAVQRFYGDWPGGVSSLRSHLMEIKDAAEATGRSFYVMYDFSGWRTNDGKSVDAIKSEWILNIEQTGVAGSPNYAHAENKPVVCIWGLGRGYENNWVPDSTALELATWFRGRGYFVIGGSVDNPNTWTTIQTLGGTPRETQQELQAHQNAYAAFDMLMPWPVGRYGDTYNSTQNWMNSNFPAMRTFCNANPRSWADNQPIKIMGGIYTGGGWTNLGNQGSPNSPPKDAGQPMWNQVYLLFNNTNNKPDTFYVCMFDEYDESTAIMKAGSDYFDIPTDQWFLTLSTDGWWLSNDYYLRVAGAGIEIIKGQRAATQTIDIPHSLGPLYYRNSFEKRDGWRNVTAVSQSQQAQNQTITGVREKMPDLALDPCLRNPASLSKGSGVTLTTNAIPAGADGAGKNGRFVFHFAGSGNGSAYYKIGDVKINASAALELKYSLKPLDAGGRNVFVDILFSDGSLWSETNGGVIAQRGTVNTWTDVTVTGIPAGKAITGVVVGYSGNGAFSAHVDDIIIEKP